ncbi:EAL domain-containing protein [Massilia sp. Root418]|uniref:EAL domain-containing protein n=1 Tax=Massilia sp. Root418 TaxID=1736532 RepID=UPI0012F634A5|nr:EAL domain-containing protein [Massilia sp. Root418]
MLARFEQLSLRLKLAFGFSTVLTLLLCVGAVALFSHHSSIQAIDSFLDRDNQISTLSLSSQASMSRARRYEKEFLLKVKVYSFQEARSRYATLVTGHLADVRANLAAIRRLSSAPAEAAAVQSIELATQQYEAGFLRVVALYGRLGSAGTGLEGELQASARAIEALLAADAPEQLRSSLLRLRRHEKNFLLHAGPRDAAAFHTEAARLRSALAQAGLPPARGASLAGLLEQYQGRFRQYTAVAADAEASMQDYLGAVHQIEPRMMELRDQADQAMAATRRTIHRQNQRLTWSIAGFSLLAMLLGLGLARYIVHKANRSVGACMDFARSLAGGDWSARLPPPAGRNEFAMLSGALNSMADAMQQGHQRAQLHAAELERLNRTLRMLSQCKDALVSAENEDQLLDTVCQSVVDTGGYALAWVGLAHGGEAAITAPAASAGRDAGSVAQLAREWQAGCGLEDLCAGAINARRAIAAHQLRPGLADVPRLPGAPWTMAVPLLARGTLLGVLGVHSAAAQPFDFDEMRMLQELADELAFGLVSLRDGLKRAAAEQALDYQANHDPVTGLANGNLFCDRVQQALLHAARTGGEVAVLVLGLDRYRAVKDGLGLDAANLMLQHVAAVLSHELREGDTLARLSGEELAVAIGEARSADELAAIAHALLRAVQQPLPTAHGELYTTISVGICLHPRDGSDAGTLLRGASAAMSSAQAMGGNQSHFFAPEMNARAARLFALEAELRRALEQDELRLHYQPRVHLASGELCAAEALVRWQHPQRGLVPPNDFIAVAESTGLIVPLGAWVIREVCRQQRAWLDAGLPAAPVAVNLSARQLRHAGLVQFIEQALAEHGLPARYLEMEITESALLEDIGQAQAMLRALKDTGIRISLDDFGTGHSSLSRLRHLPIDHLKIDQSFVRNLTTEPGDAAVCHAIIDLAHNLHMTVIAEGVETEGQANYLRKARCDEMQGYYYARPLPAAEFAALLQRKRTLPAPQGDAHGRTVLLVDDEPNILSSLQRLLRRDGYRILTAGSGAEGLELLSLHRVQVILSDQRMPGMSGSEFLGRAGELYPDTVRIMLSGYTDLRCVTESVNRGAIYKFLTKPWEDDDLRADVRAAFQRHETAARRSA